MLRRYGSGATVAGDARLDFSLPFLPESLAGTETLGFLDGADRLVLNQIRGHGYLEMFGLAAAFEEDFAFRCEAFAPPDGIAERVLSHQPLAVTLATLHIEWMTQRHHLAVVRNGTGLDPRMRSLLHHRWLEDDRNTRLHAVERIAAAATLEAAREAVEGYLSICRFIDEGLLRQVELDIEALGRATGRSLDDEATERIRRAQRRAQRWTFLGSGMTHPRFVATLEELGSEHRLRVAEVAGRYL